MSCKVPEVDEGPGLEVGICGGGGPGRCHGIRSAAEAARGGRIQRKAAADENESDGDDGVRRRGGQVTSTAALTGGEMQPGYGREREEVGRAPCSQSGSQTAVFPEFMSKSAVSRRNVCTCELVGGCFWLSGAHRRRDVDGCNWWIHFDTGESTGSSRKRCGLFHRGWVGA